MRRFLIGALSAATLTACSASNPPLETVEYVDIDRFMGDWYVIAHIPTFLEDEAYNAVERYALDEDGTIATTFTFLEGGFDGEEKRYEPRGFIRDTESNAVWGMRFVWPIKADYRVMYLDDNYRITIIGRNQRDFVWLMARTPQISDAEYSHALELIEAAGYSLDGLRKVPQRW